MKKMLAAIVALTITLFASAEYHLVPAPAKMAEANGSLTVLTPITVAGKAAADMAKYLTQAGIAANVAKKGVATATIDSQLAPEQYTLNINDKGITVAAGSTAGLFNAVQTLRQMLAQAPDGQLQYVAIDDQPRFGYRGLMLDVVRCYLPMQDLYKIADAASQLKINNLHLHLTDDNGWRLEIKQYPRLTEVGAWRVDRPDLFPARLNARSADEPATYGGVYTQDEMRAFVQYCADRNIRVVPEIEMPAHSAALLAAYPELACPVVDKFIGVFPGIGGKDASIIGCAGNDKIFDVYRGILDEVCDIFPSEYIHLGGDEADKTIWEQCPKCQQRIADQHLADCEALQGWFMDQLIAHVRAKGRQAIGWDEVTMGKPNEPLAIMGWRGLGQAAINYAKESGRPFILTPARVLYLIRYQGPQWFEPFTYFGNNTLKDVYDYEPVADDWSPAMQEQLLGIQASMWTEFCRSAADVEYLVFPRLLASAERAWSPKEHNDWQGFLKAADLFLPSLNQSGITYSQAMYNPQHTVVPNGDGTVSVTLECIRPDVEMRYADASDGRGIYRPYTGPITVGKAQKLYASTYDGPTQKGQLLMLDLKFSEATGRSVAADKCTNELAHVLTNGVRGSEKNSDFEWAGWHNRDAEFVVDLGAVKRLQSVALGNMVHADLCIAAPQTVTIYGSADGNEYTQLGQYQMPADRVFAAKLDIADIPFDGLDADARYLKVVATNPGKIPDGMAREGTATWMYFDEITVK